MMEPRVLLVEDNEANADMLRRRLARRGWTVAVAADGMKALIAARREKPDLILMDISLPEIDGWEVTRRLKADRETAHIPILALTAHVMPSDREQCFAAGCSEFEAKPIEIERLLGKMRALVGQGDAR
ncbi:MAG: response regulator [Vicinamibacterales bacterium]